MNWRASRRSLAQGLPGQIELLFRIRLIVSTPQRYASNCIKASASAGQNGRGSAGDQLAFAVSQLEYLLAASFSSFASCVARRLVASTRTVKCVSCLGRAASVEADAHRLDWSRCRLCTSSPLICPSRFSQLFKSRRCPSWKRKVAIQVANLFSSHAEQRVQGGFVYKIIRRPTISARGIGRCSTIWRNPFAAA